MMILKLLKKSNSLNHLRCLFFPTESNKTSVMSGSALPLKSSPSSRMLVPESDENFVNFLMKMYQTEVFHKILLLAKSKSFLVMSHRVGLRKSMLCKTKGSFCSKILTTLWFVLPFSPFPCLSRRYIFIRFTFPVNKFKILIPHLLL